MFSGAAESNCVIHPQCGRRLPGWCETSWTRTFGKMGQSFQGEQAGHHEKGVEQKLATVMMGSRLEFTIWS